MGVARALHPTLGMRWAVLMDADDDLLDFESDDADAPSLANGEKGPGNSMRSKFMCGSLHE